MMITERIVQNKDYQIDLFKSNINKFNIDREFTKTTLNDIYNIYSLNRNYWIYEIVKEYETNIVELKNYLFE